MEVEIRGIMERVIRNQQQRARAASGRSSSDRSAARLRAQRVKYGDFLHEAAALVARDAEVFLSALSATVRLEGSNPALEDPSSLVVDAIPSQMHIDLPLEGSYSQMRATSQPVFVGVTKKFAGGLLLN